MQIEWPRLSRFLEFETGMDFPKLPSPKFSRDLSGWMYQNERNLTVLYYAILYDTIRYDTMRYYTMRYYTIPEGDDANLARWYLRYLKWWSVSLRHSNNENQQMPWSVTGYSQMKSVTKCWMVEPFLVFVFQGSKTPSSIISKETAKYETSTSTQILSCKLTCQDCMQKIAFPSMAGSYHVVPPLQLPHPPLSHCRCWATLTNMIWLASDRFPTAADSASQPKVTIGKLLVIRFLCGSWGSAKSLIYIDGTVWSHISHIYIYTYCILLYIYAFVRKVQNK